MAQRSTSGTSDQARATTPQGIFVGADDGRVAVWKGIRYAEPPTGERRWRAPRPAPALTKPFHATRFGSAAPQAKLPTLNLGEGVTKSEDCLFLNIWSPGFDETAVGSSRSEPKPVMVWFHGGAYTYGSGSQPVYDGTALSSFGDLVIVTVNYRLGALGFLDLSSFSFDSDIFDTNLALRDVLLALEWVRDNIAGFGGDPSNVTVFGESAGAGIVTALLAAPAAAGLFHRAIAQSSPASSMYGPERSRAVAERFLAEAGISTERIEEVRYLPVADVVAAATRIYSAVPSEAPGRLAFAPVIDGDLLPEHPLTVLHQGRGHPVPLIIGTNRDESALFRFLKSPLMPITPTAITTMMKELAADNPDVTLPTREQLLGTYENVRQRAVGLGIATDIGFRVPTLWLVEGHSRVAPTYLYRFDWAAPMLKVIGMGAAHATELPYVWGNLELSRRDFTFKLGGRRIGHEVSARVMSWWTCFATEGHPGERWPAYTDERASVIIDRTDSIVEDADAALRSSWGDAVVSFT